MNSCPQLRSFWQLMVAVRVSFILGCAIRWSFICAHIDNTEGSQWMGDRKWLCWESDEGERERLWRIRKHWRGRNRYTFVQIVTIHMYEILHNDDKIF